MVKGEEVVGGGSVYSADAIEAMRDIRDWFSGALSNAARDIAEMDGRRTVTEDDVIRASLAIKMEDMGYEDEDA